MALIAHRLGASIGALIRGLDLGRPLSAADVSWIAEAWSSYGVLVFRDQVIDDNAHARFAGHFGALAAFLSQSRAVANLSIYSNSNTDEDGQLFAAGDTRAEVLKINWHWHIDGCYRPAPTRGVVQRALEVPPEGGDTIFADLAHAWEALPPSMKSRIDGLVCCHSFGRMVERCAMPPVSPQEAGRLPEAMHPLIRTHGNGRRSLFLSPPYMAGIEGLSNAGFRALVDELVAWSVADRFLYRHRWSPGDVVMWDNRWTMHRVAPFDLARHRRVMRGATLVSSAQKLVNG